MKARLTTLVLVLGVLIAAGCSDDAPGEALGSSSTSQSLGTQPLASSELTLSTTPVGSTDLPEPSQPNTTLEPADTALPPSGSILINEADEPVTLDETASLACALVDLATESVRVGDIDGAIVALGQAADRAEPSSLKDISAEAEAMRQSNAETVGDTAAVVRALCVGHGHQV